MHSNTAVYSHKNIIIVLLNERMTEGVTIEQIKTARHYACDEI